MANQVNSEDTALALRERIDEVAAQMIVGSGPGVHPADSLREFTAALSHISDQARKTGYQETARVAAVLGETMGEEGSSPDLQAVEDAITAGIAQLQQVLEEESRRPPVDEPARVPASNPPTLSLAQDPELVSDFVVESRDHLTAIEAQVLVLEKDPDNEDAIHSVFRGFHTIKGLAGFLEFETIQVVAHEVETILDLARNSKLAITPAVVDVILESADYLKQWVAALASTLGGQPLEAPGDHTGLLLRVQALGHTEALEQMKPAPAEVPLVSAGGESPAVEGVPGAAASGTTEEAPPPSGEPRKANTPAKAANAFSVRVDTAKLDYLVEMVGEMVIAQSLIRHNPTLAGVRDPRLVADLSQLARITSEVQRTTMTMRMIPVGLLFQRTARLVRDLSRKAGKQVEVETRGEDTELDKTIAEELADPLMHMVRNSVDHGIESGEDRVAAGKRPVAKVQLAAYHQGGQIVVEVSDDGRGLDREKILKKAKKNGLIDSGAYLSDTEVYNLIFEPGFSTADQVTDVSGRGVGMDVVRKHVQKLRGRIDIQSKPGQGTTFFLKLPLTLAIIEGLVVGVGAHRYIVPIYAVREIVRPTAGSVTNVQGSGEVALVRDRLLPVVRLHQRFDVVPRSEDPCEGLLVIAEREGKFFGLLVDELIGKHEVVIKGLGETLKDIPGVAGGAILGDGRVGLILDLEGVFGAAVHD
jgi:two-component system, chemotaxis family, sensor kinase CheA